MYACKVSTSAGDITCFGRTEEFISFLEWLDQQPYTHKIVIGGNHDMTLDKPFYARYAEEFSRYGATTKVSQCDSIEGLLRKRCIYLKDSAVEIMG